MFYRYTSEREGVFSKGKQPLPQKLIAEVLEAKKWLPKPTLPEGKYAFYLTEEGNKRYIKTLLPLHKQYLTKITCEKVKKVTQKDIIYQDEYQVVVKLPKSETQPL